MSSKLNTFDIAKYLNSNEVITEYLSQILEDGDLDELLSAIGDIREVVTIHKKRF